MKSAQIPETINTKLSILKSIFSRKDESEFRDAIKKYGTEFSEEQLLDLIEYLGLNGNHKWVDLAPQTFTREFTREFEIKMKNICIHLLHMKQVDASMYFYEKFVNPLAEQNYGFFLLKEMLHLSIDANILISFAQKYKNQELNLTVLEQLTGLALRLGYVDTAWILLSNMENLRPHYFWPLLIIAKNTNGEKGLMDELKKIQELNVHLDAETLEQYIFQLCDISTPELLIKKLQEYNYTVRELLSPFIMTMLRNNDLGKAASAKYNVEIKDPFMLYQLAYAWSKTHDTTSAVYLLGRYCESNVSPIDNTSEFLKRAIELCTGKHVRHFENLLKAIHDKQLRIKYTNSEIILNIAASKTKENIDSLRKAIKAITDLQITPEPSHIPHPRDMNLEQLECHLEELTDKKMETRGLIRRLIQMHCNNGNHSRVEELRALFIEKGYDETAGMISSMMHSYIQGDHVEEALELYKTMKTHHPTFSLDEFKIIDLVAILIKRDDIENAHKILLKESTNRRILGGQSILRNCKDLLNSFQNVKDQKEMFEMLLKLGYCKPTNILLGSIMRLHLKIDLKTAVDKYIECTDQYNCTPLQFELLCQVIDENDGSLLAKVLQATEKVHGTTSALGTYVTALAEKGKLNALEKFLSTTNISLINNVNQKCDRWIKEGKVEPMQNLLKASSRISSMIIDRDHVCRSIMHIYNMQNNCEEAIKFVNSISEESFIQKELKKQLEVLLRKCNYRSNSKLNIVNT